MRDPSFGRRDGNDQNRPFHILSLGWQGEVSTFSPELLGLTHPTYGSFSFDPGSDFESLRAGCSHVAGEQACGTPPGERPSGRRGLLTAAGGQVAVELPLVDPPSVVLGLPVPPDDDAPHTPDQAPSPREPSLSGSTTGGQSFQSRSRS